jgi:DNA-binding response OmpR family regulator
VTTIRVEAASESVPYRDLKMLEVILLVDDEEAFLSATRRILAREGYSVLAAGESGESSIAKPFTITSLLAETRALLDAKRRGD